MPLFFQGRKIPCPTHIAFGERLVRVKSNNGQCVDVFVVENPGGEGMVTPDTEQALGLLSRTLGKESLGILDRQPRKGDRALRVWKTRGTILP